jgi:hypothetical protein
VTNEMSLEQAAINLVVEWDGESPFPWKPVAKAFRGQRKAERERIVELLENLMQVAMEDISSPYQAGAVMGVFIHCIEAIKRQGEGA